MKPKRATWHELYEATLRQALALGQPPETAELLAGRFVRYVVWLEMGAGHDAHVQGRLAHVTPPWPQGRLTIEGGRP